MEQYLPILKRTKLMAGVAEDEIRSMLQCLDARLHRYRKGEYVFRQGEHIQHITVLAEGELHLQRDDYWGNRTIIQRIAEGEMFGEACLAPENSAILHDVVAVEDSAVIFFDVRRVITVCGANCRFHSTVVQNLFFAISEKNRRLVRKIGHISQRTTREKLISYLSEESIRQGSASIAIPFNRQQLADYLSVDRSAMSSELGRMRDEGLLTFEKNKFHLLV